MASLFTSLEPSSHGVLSGEALGSYRNNPALRIVNQPLLAPSLPTLAETLQAAGYTTVGVAANMHLAKHLGFAQGFRYYYDQSFFLDAPLVNRQVEAQLLRPFRPP